MSGAERERGHSEGSALTHSVHMKAPHSQYRTPCNTDQPTMQPQLNHWPHHTQLRHVPLDTHTHIQICMDHSHGTQTLLTDTISFTHTQPTPAYTHNIIHIPCLRLYTTTRQHGHTIVHDVAPSVAHRMPAELRATNKMDAVSLLTSSWPLLLVASPPVGRRWPHR